jgi:hypothetical protein
VVIVRRPARRRGWRAWLWLIAAAFGAALLPGGRLSSTSLRASLDQTPPPAPQSSDLERQARVVCGSCHAYPPPDILPRDNWRDEFVRMMFIREGRLPPIGPPGLANRNVQLPADMEQVLPFYVSRAPERLPAPEPWPDPAAPSPLTFTRRSLSVPGMPGTPAVSHVRLIDLDGDGQLDVVAPDARTNEIRIWTSSAN